MFKLDEMAIELSEKLEKSDCGLELEYKPGYRAVASRLDYASYLIEYFKTYEDMPAFDSENYKTSLQCAKEMLRIGINWSDIVCDEC